MKKDMLLAKSTQNGGIELLPHLKATGLKCLELSRLLTDDKKIQSLACLSGLFHDLGKATPEFQEMLKGNGTVSVDHGALSLAWLNQYVYIKMDSEDSCRKDGCFKSILYHHPLRFDESIVDNKLDDYSEVDIKPTVIELVDFYQSLNIGGYSVSLRDESEEMPSIDDRYKRYLDGGEKCVRYTVFFSMILRFADALTSNESLSFEDICFRKDRTPIEFKHPAGYDDRFEVQKEKAIELSKLNNSCFIAETSFGKTLCGLMWLLANDRKGYWVCPRNTIAKGVYETVCKELKALGLEDRISVTLLLTNEYMGGKGAESDIIITNIDNLMRPYSKADANIRSFTLLHSNCIFDEFHEYLTDEAILASYLTLKYVRENFCSKGNTKTLYMTATYIERLYGDKNTLFKYPCKQILDRTIKVNFVDSMPEDDIKGTNTLYLVNSVTETQNAFRKGRTDNLIHARYLDGDREKKFNAILCNHGKKGTFDTSWSADNVISTGIDISFGKLITCVSSPERLLQSLGRVGRWDELSGIRELYLFNATSSSERCAIGTFYPIELATMFYNFLKKRITNGTIVTYGTLYSLVDEFYQDSNVSKKFKDFWGKCKTSSFDGLSLILYKHSHKGDNSIVYASDEPSIRTRGRADGKESYFFKLVNDETGTPTDEAFEFELNRDEAMEYFSTSGVDRMKAYLKRPEIMPKYFRAKQQFENTFKSPDKAVQALMKRAKCSETPYPLFVALKYNKDIGIYKIK